MKTAIFGILVFSTMGFGKDGNPDNWCREGHFAKYGGYRVGVVTGAKKSRAYLFDDQGECPKSTDPKCKTKRYLVPGDDVLAAHSFNGFVCVWYQPANLKKSSTLGWVAESALSLKDAKAADADGWLGTWRYGTNELVVGKGKDGGKFQIEGSATWDGGNGNVHVGAVKGEAALAENVLVVKEEDCEVKAERYGKFLLVSDNRACGGVNVAFDGVYLRGR